MRAGTVDLAACMCVCVFFLCKQKTAYELRISDWSSDVCSSDLPADRYVVVGLPADAAEHGARQEHRASPPAVELVRSRGFAEAQVELEAGFDVGQRDRKRVV